MAPRLIRGGKWLKEAKGTPWTVSLRTGEMPTEWLWQEGEEDLQAEGTLQTKVQSGGVAAAQIWKGWGWGENLWRRTWKDRWKSGCGGLWRPGWEVITICWAMRHHQRSKQGFDAAILQEKYSGGAAQANLEESRKHQLLRQQAS